MTGSGPRATTIQGNLQPLAALLTVTAKRFGVEPVQRTIDETVV